MENTKKTEYVVVVNGQPFFAVLDKKNLDAVLAEVALRFGDSAPVEVVVHISYPYTGALSKK